MTDVSQQQCQVCGHPLRPDERVCPECGNPRRDKSSVLPPFEGHMGFYLNIGISSLFIIAFLIYGIYSLLA